VQKNVYIISFPPEVDVESLLLRSRGIFPKSIKENHEKYSWFSKRITAEMELLRLMDDYEFDLLVLAGFMRNLTAYFIDQVNIKPNNPRIMNIHPALLPAFPGTNGYGDTFRYGCKVGGCTVHFVDYGEDTGPIIGQRVFPIFPYDTLEKIKERGLELEWELYPECIKLFAEGLLRVVERDGRKIVEIAEVHNHPKTTI